METNPLSGTAPVVSNNSNNVGNGTNISSDFNTFLTMLTAQVENQDPLNPIDSTDFAVQLATFSGVEQQVQTNDLLKQLVSEKSVAGLAELANWVGKDAQTTSMGYWGGTPLQLSGTVENTATSAQLLVRDASGAEIFRGAIDRSAKSWTWDGTNSGGEAVSTGTYQFDIISLENGSPISESPASVYSKVIEVRNENGTNQIVIEGGTTLDAADVLALRESQT